MSWKIIQAKTARKNDSKNLPLRTESLLQPGPVPLGSCPPGPDVREALLEEPGNGRDGSAQKDAGDPRPNQVRLKTFLDIISKENKEKDAFQTTGFLYSSRSLLLSFSFANCFLAFLMLYVSPHFAIGL